MAGAWQTEMGSTFIELSGKIDRSLRDAETKGFSIDDRIEIYDRDHLKWHKDEIAKELSQGKKIDPFAEHIVRSADAMLASAASQWFAFFHVHN